MPSSFTPRVVVFQAGSSRPRLAPVAAGQELKKGDLVILDANGRVTHAAAAVSTNVAAATASTNHLYLMEQNSPSSTPLGEQVLILAVDEGTTLSLPLCAGDAGLAFDQAFVGKAYELRRHATDRYCVNQSATTNPKVEVIGRDPSYPTSDAFQNVLVRPITGQWGK
jgi:hypothetical protein